MASHISMPHGACTRCLRVRQLRGAGMACSLWSVIVRRPMENDGVLRGKCARCDLLQPPRSVEMAKRTVVQTYTNEDFEAKAQELLSMALAMSEERILAAPKLETPIGNALAEAAMALKYAMRTFLAVNRLQGK